MVSLDRAKVQGDFILFVLLTVIILKRVGAQQRRWEAQVVLDHGRLLVNVETREVQKRAVPLNLVRIETVLDGLDW